MEKRSWIDKLSVLFILVLALVCNVVPVTANAAAFKKKWLKQKVTYHYDLDTTDGFYDLYVQVNEEDAHAVYASFYQYMAETLVDTVPVLGCENAPKLVGNLSMLYSTPGDKTFTLILENGGSEKVFGCYYSYAKFSVLYAENTNEPVLWLKWKGLIHYIFKKSAFTKVILTGFML